MLFSLNEIKNLDFFNDDPRLQQMFNELTNYLNKLLECQNKIIQHLATKNIDTKGKVIKMMNHYKV